MRTFFPNNVEEFFSSGTVILFSCAATADYPLLSVSENCADILGFKPSYFLENKTGWSARIHPDDIDFVDQNFQRIMRGKGDAINEYRFKTRENSYIWLRDEIKFIEDARDGKPLIYGSTIDITERKKAEIALKENKTEELRQEISLRKKTEEKLQKRLDYEKAISRISELLLESYSSEALQESLEILQRVTEADRIFLFSNKEVDDEQNLDPIIETAAEGISTVVKDLEKPQFKYSDIPWLYDKLSSFQKVQAQIDKLPEPEQSFLRKQHIKSILLIPIVMDEEWKGCIGFSDTKSKRVWEEEEVSLLETTSRLIAAFKKRKSIEQSLVEQRNYTKAILDSLPSIYLLMDEEFNFVQWNENAKHYTGYNADELKEKNVFDLIAPKDHGKLEKATNEAIEAQGVELQLRTKEGNDIPYFWNGYYIELGQKKYFLCVGIDITQQKKVQKALKQEKQFNEGLIQSLPGIFYTLDENANYTQWNRNFEKELGYEEHEIRNMKPKDFYTGKELEKITGGIEEAFEKGYSMLEAKITTKSGKEIPYLLTARLIENDGKKYITGVGHDISDRIEAREKLKKSEELFRNLFLNAPAAIAMISPENNVLNVNKSFENLFGYTEKEIKGKDLDELIVPEEEYEEVPKMAQDKESAMDSFQKEARRITKGGTLIDVFVAGIPVFVDEEPLAGFGMYIDITEQKKYEEEIYTSLKEKHVLLQEIHHRVKNNLAVVSGLLQLQIYETDDPVIQETLKESENRIQTMALIHEKLYNSRNLARISCQSYISELVETIRNTIGSNKDIDVHIDIEDIKLSINKAVPFALLVNEVVTNSFKHAFTNKEEGTIEIYLRENDDQIHAHLKDDGRGLPEDFSSDEIESLGMTLIQNFAQQLDADWEIGSDGGTFINISFDISDMSGGSTSEFAEF